MDGNVPEELCKVAEVQRAVSNLNGSSVVLTLLPTLLAALPYLALNRLAKKQKTLLLNALGGLMMNVYYMSVLYFYNAFDPRWIWLSGLFSFIGGGDLVFYTLLQALIAESIPHNSLSTFYLYSSATALLVKVIGSASGLSMMKSSNWLPVLLSVTVKMLSIPIILLLLRDPAPVVEYTKIGDLELEGIQEADSSTDGNDKPIETATGHTSIWRSVMEQDGTLRRCLFPLTICALQEVGNSVRFILPYWLSRRYHWTLRETGWVSLGEVLLTALIVSLLPQLSKRLQQARGGHSSKDRDLALAKTCLGFSTLGTALLGVSWYKLSGVISLAVLAGGTAFRDAYLGYVTADLQKHEIAQVYMVLSMVSLSAFSVGGWVIAGIYSISLLLGDSWQTSLPIWACSVPFALAWYCLR